MVEEFAYLEEGLRNIKVTRRRRRTTKQQLMGWLSFF
jgi:hypothetical protein